MRTRATPIDSISGAAKPLRFITRTLPMRGVGSRPSVNCQRTSKRTGRPSAVDAFAAAASRQHEMSIDAPAAKATTTTVAASSGRPISKTSIAARRRECVIEDRAGQALAPSTTLAQRDASSCASGGRSASITGTRMAATSPAATPLL